MQKITTFFLRCSGADTVMLEKCPSETSKYVGIGGTIFFTGLFAAMSGGYALYTVFDSAWLAILFGTVWGLMIFNLDRYIVSSMRKEGKPAREWLMATPRIMLAVLISIVIAKPLELKIFEKEINPELVSMEQQAFRQHEELTRARFAATSDSLRAEVTRLKSEIVEKAAQRDALVKAAQEEADGTGGSRKRNLGPIYKVKKADADKAEAELAALEKYNREHILLLEKRINDNEAQLSLAIASLDRSKINGPAARIDALDHITERSDAVYWAHIFIMLLFVAVETAPVLVKLIAGKGPYDNLLKVEEHQFIVHEIEEKARMNTQAKEKTAGYPQHERTYITTRLDAELQ